MKAIIWKDIQKYEIVNIPKPAISAPDDVLVRVEVTSICGTDVRILNDDMVRQGRLGMMLGHEAVGVIEEMGSEVCGFEVGDKVVLDPFVPCGQCYFCRHGQPHICSNLMVKGCRGDDGFFAEYVLSKPTGLIKVSKNMPLEYAVFCEPLYCVLGAVKKVNFQPGERVAILGQGPIGQYFTQVFRYYGASLIVVSERSPVRAELAGKSGADNISEPEKIRQDVYRLTDDIGVDVCVDAVGFLLGDAIAVTRPGGRIIAFGKQPDKIQSVCEADIVNKGLSIYGNTQGDFTFQAAADLIASGGLNLEPLITHRFSIDEFGKAIDVMKRGEGMEVLVYPNPPKGGMKEA